MADPKKGLAELEQTGLTVSQVADEVLYTELIEMQQMLDPAECPPADTSRTPP